MMDTWRSIWNTFRETRNKWIEHFIRNNTWVTTKIDGRINGKTVKERPRTSFMKHVMKDTGINTYVKLKRLGIHISNWDRWRKPSII